MADMRTTITIDDELFRKAVEVADPGMDKAEIVREAEREFARRKIRVSMVRFRRWPPFPTR